MITLADQGAQILPLVARYSPEFQCFLHGMVAQIRPNEQAFREQDVCTSSSRRCRSQPRGYNVNDLPQFADNRGAFPYCSSCTPRSTAGTARTTSSPSG